jgi:cytochrome c-type biogenesis protein CcmH
MDESLTRLESRLAAQGGTDADWQLLAQTYDFMGRAADAQSARSHQLPASANAADAAAPDSQQTPQPAGGAAPDSAQLDGTVELADALQSQVPAGLTLFVVAKAVDAPGPPVAVLRSTTNHWPVRFSLDDASAMVPDRKLSTVGSVTVQARVSRSGLATPQSGDFQSALATVQPRQRKSVRLVIDHVIR